MRDDCHGGSQSGRIEREETWEHVVTIEGERDAAAAERLQMATAVRPNVGTAVGLEVRTTGGWRWERRGS